MVVVGGGVSGLKAALELCAVGAKVSLSPLLMALQIVHVGSSMVAEELMI